MRRSDCLEYNESVTNAFLKTVSAFANYGAGDIWFGIAEDGTVKGIDEPEKACQMITRRINSSMKPVPEFTLSVNKKTAVVMLHVTEGLQKPYLYRSRAYRRSEAETTAVNELELSRLVLEGQNMSFEELPAKNQQLTFRTLEKKMAQSLGVSLFTKDTLKALELYRDGEGYNNAAELLSDNNRFAGTDLVRFGVSMNIILDREIIEHKSILEQYDQALETFRKYYQYEQIRSRDSEIVSMIPEKAFCEAAANALVHRTWDSEVNISILMFPDKIEIVFPGGLPRGVSEEDYVKGGAGVPRNRIIGNIFYRLQMIERFGTGIQRIHEAYKNSAIKPVFAATQNIIRITLPVFREKNDLTPDEDRIYQFLKGKTAPSSAVIEETGFGKSKTVAILNRLVAASYIRIQGTGRGTKYSAE